MSSFKLDHNLSKTPNRGVISSVLGFLHKIPDRTGVLVFHTLGMKPDPFSPISVQVLQFRVVMVRVEGYAK